MIAEYKRRYAHTIASTCLAIAGALAWGTASAHVEEPAYTVGVIADVAKGRSILAEHYDGSITRLEAREARGINRFYVANNLCVAYLKTGRLEEARRACDTAVTTMESYVESRDGSPRSFIGGTQQALTYRRYLALALSNRGVALAVSGATEKARDDFALALELRPSAREPELNLTRLAMAG